MSSLWEGLPVVFQEAIRDQYPVMNEQQIVGLRISAASAMVSNVQQIEDQTSKVFNFASADNQAKVSLNSAFIAATTNQYVTWDSFRERLIFVFKKFVEIYKPSFIERTGLRYINIIVPKKLNLEGTAWKDILSPNLNGVFANLDCPHDDVQSLDGSFQCKFKEADQFVTVQHGLVTNNATSEVGYKIDGDFWTQTRMEENLDDVLTVLDGFRKGAGNLFRWGISNTLHEAMGPTRGE